MPLTLLLVKLLPLTFLLFLTILTSAQPLQDLKWKNRILVISLPTTSPATAQATEIRKILQQNLAELKDRDLAIVPLASTELDLPLQKEYSPIERAQLREFFKLSDTTQPTFILIGKDGGEKARQSPTLDLRKLLALIDTMPMRQAESQSQ